MSRQFVDEAKRIWQDSVKMLKKATTFFGPEFADFLALEEA